MEWRDAVCVVTGASRGIGREVARMAADRGVRLGLVARSARDLVAVGKELGDLTDVVTVAADVGDRAAIAAAVSTIAARPGLVDVLVNNAGVGAFGAFSATDPEVCEHLMRTNFLVVVYATHAVLPGMMARCRGHVVNVGSIAGRVGAPFEAAYSATKFAVAGFTEALAVELSAFGIGVSLVSPGVVDTGFFEARGHEYGRSWPRPVPPSAVADAVMRAVSAGRGQIVVPGWLRGAVAVKSVVPSLQSWGTRRAFATELERYRAGG